MLKLILVNINCLVHSNITALGKRGKKKKKGGPVLCLVTPVIKEILILIANENSVFEKKKKSIHQPLP